MNALRQRPEYLSDVQQVSVSGMSAVAVALRVLTRYPRRLPTVAELREDFGMSRATAFRWRAELRAVRGIA